MNDAPAAERPDPDALLRSIATADEKSRRGKLRLYFGASAGVGKTYAMLAAARVQQEQGVRVLAGVVETHGRHDTAALLDGMEQLARKDVAYRGHVLKEFDLEGAIERRPDLVLVDELAHSNAAGSRHAKRWQDVEELLGDGIDVWTTLNAQHLESLNEAVSSITGVQVWETVPDKVFDAADEVILIDLPADELLRRLEEGKVYLPDQARHAARNFFRKGNLIALRELALRRTADRVDDDVLAYRRDRAIDAVWRTREAVVACIGPENDVDHIVRSAHKLARQLDCDLHVVTMEAPRVAPYARRERAVLQTGMALAETLGAQTETLPGSDMVEALASYVRRHNITKVVVGRGAGERHRAPGAWLTWLISSAGIVRRKSFADLLALRCPEVDVVRLAASTHVERVADPAPQPSAEVVATLAASWRDYAWAVVYCGLAVGGSLLAFTVLHQTNIVMLFLLAVVGVALRHGRGPAAFASVLGVAAFDFFFVLPLRSFAVSDVQYLVTFFVMLAVGLLIGQLTAGLRSQATTSVQRENHARALYEFARELSSSLLPEQIVASAGSFVRASFQARCALFIMDEGNKVEAAITDVDDLPPPDAALAQWVCDHGQPAGAGTDTLSASSWLYLPLKAPMRTRGVLAVESSRHPSLAQHDMRRQLDACATLIAIALERLHYVEIAQKALISMESEKLRGSLLAAISHDLRTPLTSLVGMADNLLRGEPRLPPERQDVVVAMRAQTLRMRTMVVNLLDMARLQSRAVPVRMEWQSVEELVGAALADMGDALAGHRVSVTPLSSLPLVECDGVLIERVLCNLLENASKYAPVGGRIHIDAAVEGGWLRVRISDDGPGVPAGRERAIFEKFTRGERESATTGVGLGLAICEAIIGIHHGSIWVESAAPDYTGARFVFTLPLGTAPVPYPEPLV